MANELTGRHALYYAEAGNMLRHYSTCRFTLIAIAYPALLAIFSQFFSEQSFEDYYVLLIFANIMVVALVILISLFFSFRYNQTLRYLQLLEAETAIGFYTATTVLLGTRKIKLDLIDYAIFITLFVLHASLYSYLIFWR